LVLKVHCYLTVEQYSFMQLTLNLYLSLQLLSMICIKTVSQVHHIAIATT